MEPQELLAQGAYAPNSHTENKNLINHVVVNKLKDDLLLVHVKFLRYIKYKPSINKYCLEDILKPYNKRKSEFLRLPTAISFMKKYPKLFTTVKKGNTYENIYIDYTVIEAVLSWIDMSLFYEFRHDLDLTEPDKDGYIYLVQCLKDIKEHIVKVGRTYNIKERYQGKVDVIGIEYVEDMREEEKKLINEFKKKYGEPVRGNEFFRCNKIEDAIKTFYDVVYDNETTEITDEIHFHEVGPDTESFQLKAHTRQKINEVRTAHPSKMKYMNVNHK